MIACKGVAYSASLSGFRGGPIFPGMFIGAALGIAFSHLPGLPLIAGVGIGIGAMTCAMLGLPLVSVLLASLLLAADGVDADAAHHRRRRRVVHRLGAPRTGTRRRPRRRAPSLSGR